MDFQQDSLTYEFNASAEMMTSLFENLNVTNQVRRGIYKAGGQDFTIQRYTFIGDNNLTMQFETREPPIFNGNLKRCFLHMGPSRPESLEYFSSRILDLLEKNGVKLREIKCGTEEV